MKRLLTVALGVLTLSACATGPLWTKPGATEFQIQQAERDCRREADAVIAQSGGYRYYQGSGPGTGDDPMAQVEQNNLAKQLNALIGSCMRAKGFAKTR